MEPPRRHLSWNFAPKARGVFQSRNRYVPDLGTVKGVPRSRFIRKKYSYRATIQAVLNFKPAFPVSEAELTASKVTIR
jgi:hypothetical protein